MKNRYLNSGHLCLTRSLFISHHNQISSVTPPLADWKLTLLNVPDGTLWAEEDVLFVLQPQGTSVTFIQLSFFNSKRIGLEKKKINGGVWGHLYPAESVPQENFFPFIWSQSHGFDMQCELVWKIWSPEDHTGVQLFAVKQWTWPITVSAQEEVKNHSLLASYTEQWISSDRSIYRLNLLQWIQSISISLE